MIWKHVLVDFLVYQVRATHVGANIEVPLPWVDILKLSWQLYHPEMMVITMNHNSNQLSGVKEGLEFDEDKSKEMCVFSKIMSCVFTIFFRFDI